MIMNGWKTYLAAGIVAISAGLEFMGYGTYATVLVMVGNALGLAGIRSAITTSHEGGAVGGFIDPRVSGVIVPRDVAENMKAGR